MKSRDPGKDNNNSHNNDNNKEVEYKKSGKLVRTAIKTEMAQQRRCYSFLLVCDNQFNWKNINRTI